MDLGGGPSYPGEVRGRMAPPDPGRDPIVLIVIQFSPSVNGVGGKRAGFCWFFCEKQLQGHYGHYGMQYN